MRGKAVGVASLGDDDCLRVVDGEMEKPHGEWNVVELVVQDDHVKHYLNGKLVNEGSKAYPASGKILIQSEGAEIYFRDIKLFPLSFDLFGKRDLKFYAEHGHPNPERVD